MPSARRQCSKLISGGINLAIIYTANLSGLALAWVLRNDAIDPLVGARHALGQVLDGRFYVTTHDGDLWERLVGNQNDDRLAGRPPRFQMFE